ncbi:MAG: DNA primase [Oscillospiraceae bacterium]|nr:DNA primase [Oscillospiraceae bacterium]
MPLPETFIYNLKQSNPLDAVMASYSRLIKRGRNYVCLCPFHSEKTPSCTVYTDNGSFFCYGCQAGGDVITFTMKIENLDYIEAVKLLSERAGLTMPEEGAQTDSSRLKSRLLEINRAAARFYYDTLTQSAQGEKGRRYLAERGVSQNTLTKYGLGYAPGDWYSLANHLTKLGFAEFDLIDANVCGRGKNGGLYDRFRDRVIFPIIDLRGNVIAFGGRVIDDGEPKYLNTSDTPVFKKSRHLFSMNLAKKSTERRLILAEGYMDVIAVNQAGFPNVAATLGTAITREQANLIKRYADEVIIAYDSDKAGVNATQKAINLLGEAGVNARIIKLGDSKDPDEYIKRNGAIRFKQLLDKSDNALDYELNKCKAGLDISDASDKVEYLKRCVNILAGSSSSIEREVYISRLASENGVQKQTLAEQVNGIIRKRKKANEKREWDDIRISGALRTANGSPGLRQSTSSVYSNQTKAERGIIAYLAKNPEEAGAVSSKITSAYFATEFHRLIYEKILKSIKNSAEFDIMSLQSEFSADEMGKITEIVINNNNIANNKTVIEDFINILINRLSSDICAKDLSDDDFVNHIKNIGIRKQQKN